MYRTTPAEDQEQERTIKKLVRQQLKESLSYNHWATQKLLANLALLSDADYFKILPIPFANVHGLFGHMLYYEVKEYTDVTCAELVADAEILKLSRQDLIARALASTQEWLTWLADENLHQQITAAEIIEVQLKVNALIAHNNYHRGQLNTVINILGYQPESLDIYIYQKQYGLYNLQLQE